MALPLPKITEEQLNTPVYQPDDPQFISRVLSQLASDVPIATIARTFNVSSWHVEKINEDYRDVIITCKNVAKYKIGRKDLLNAAEQLLLKSLTDAEVVARANLRDRAFAFKEVFAARRLEEDKSTKNVSQSITYTSVDLLDYKPKDPIDR